MWVQRWRRAELPALPSVGRWEPRLPVCAPADRQRVLTEWSADATAGTRLIRERSLPFKAIRSLRCSARTESHPRLSPPSLSHPSASPLRFVTSPTRRPCPRISHAVAARSPEQFVDLMYSIGVRGVVAGENYRFGRAAPRAALPFPPLARGPPRALARICVCGWALTPRGAVVLR